MAQHAGPLEGVWRWRGNYPLATGGFVVRSEANRYDTVRQVVHSQHRFEEYAADDALVGTSLHRLELAYLYPGDIRSLLERAGFTAVTITRAFTDYEPSSDGDELLVQASVNARVD